MKRALRIVGIISGLLLLVVVAIALINSKSIVLSQEDRVYIRRFVNDWHINATSTDVHKSFESELAFISRIQDSVLSDITGEQIPHAYFGNVRYYYQKRQGICYDRAVLLEKILLLYQFNFRHVYLYFGDKGKPGVTDFLRKNITSHAALEVKTKKGWMAMGTDANWLGIRSNGHVANYYEVRKELEATGGNPHWQNPGQLETVPGV